MSTKDGGPVQGHRAAADQSKNTTKSATEYAGLIISRRPRLRTACDRAAERVIDAAASVISLCLYVAGFRLAYELATGVIRRG